MREQKEQNEKRRASSDPGAGCGSAMDQRREAVIVFNTTYVEQGYQAVQETRQLFLVAVFSAEEFHQLPEKQDYSVLQETHSPPDRNKNSRNIS